MGVVRQEVTSHPEVPRSVASTPAPPRARATRQPTRPRHLEWALDSPRNEACASRRCACGCSGDAPTAQLAPRYSPDVESVLLVLGPIVGAAVGSMLTMWQDSRKRSEALRKEMRDRRIKLYADVFVAGQDPCTHARGGHADRRWRGGWSSAVWPSRPICSEGRRFALPSSPCARRSTRRES